VIARVALCQKGLFCAISKGAENSTGQVAVPTCGPSGREYLRATLGVSVHVFNLSRKGCHSQQGLPACRDRISRDGLFGATGHHQAVDGVDVQDLHQHLLAPLDAAYTLSPAVVPR
jgi:hypothetical protein